MFCHVLHARSAYSPARSGIAPVVRKASRPPRRSPVPDARLPEARPFPAHDARAFRGGAPVRPRARGGGGGPCGQRRRRSGSGSFMVIRASLGAKGGTGGPCFAHIVRRCVRGRAYRGGAVRAPDCPRARARGDRPGRGRTLPVRSRRGDCGPPAMLSAEKRNGGPGSRLSLMPILHHFAVSQAISGTKMKTLDSFLTTHWIGRIIPATPIRDPCLLLVMPGTSPGMTEEPVEGGWLGRAGRQSRHGFRSTAARIT